MKLAIVGTRKPSIKYSEFEQLLLDKVDLSDVTLIISGGAQGIDTFAKLLAARHHIPLMEFLPRYDVYGKYATLKRNTQIVKEANTVIAFPSAESKGTYHSIKEAERLHRRLIVVTMPGVTERSRRFIMITDGACSSATVVRLWTFR